MLPLLEMYPQHKIEASCMQKKSMKMISLSYNPILYASINYEKRFEIQFKRFMTAMSYLSYSNF